MARDTKEQLVDDVLTTVLNNVPDHKRTIIELLKDALDKKTIKELKILLEEL